MIDRYIKDILPQKPKNKKNRTLHLNWWKTELGKYALAESSPALIAERRDKLARGTLEEQTLIINSLLENIT